MRENGVETNEPRLGFKKGKSNNQFLLHATATRNTRGGGYFKVAYRTAARRSPALES
jgi:hypothetical protein